MICQAKDLSPDQRQAIESLIGQKLSEQDNVSIQRLSQPAQLSDPQRQNLVKSLESYFAKVDAQRQSVSPEEADAAIDEALRSTRPNYRPVR